MRIILLILMISSIIGWGLFINAKYNHSKYISLSEDIGAVKVGDTLTVYQKGDTTFVNYKCDHPQGNSLILLPN